MMSFRLDELPPPAGWSPARLLGARPVLLRHVSGGRIAFAMGVRQIACDHGAVLLHVADGTRFRSARAVDGSGQRSLSEWALADVSWADGEALHVITPGDWFSVICMWRRGAFVGWHVNFQRPLRPSAMGWDTEDLVLDLEVGPDGSWSLEDRADFERALAEGHLAADSGSAVLRALDDALARLEQGMAPFRDDWTVAPAIGPGAVPLPVGWDSLRG